MRRRILAFLALSLLSMLAVPMRVLADDPYSGDFTGAQLSIEIVSEGGSYSGSIHLGQQIFPFKAQASNGQLTGSFTSNEHDYPFTASVSGDTLTFSSGKSTYQLSRIAANPLNGNAPARQFEWGIRRLPLPDGLPSRRRRMLGKAWVTRKPGITTVGETHLGRCHFRPVQFFGKQSRGQRACLRRHQRPPIRACDVVPPGHLRAGRSMGLITCKLVGNASRGSA